MKCKRSFFIFLTSQFLILLYLYAAAEKLFLKSASDYNYLKHSNCLRIDGVDDAKKFSVLVVKLIASTKILLASYLAVAYAISFSAGCIGKAGRSDPRANGPVHSSSRRALHFTPGSATSRKRSSCHGM